MIPTENKFANCPRTYIIGCSLHSCYVYYMSCKTSTSSIILIAMYLELARYRLQPLIGITSTSGTVQSSCLSAMFRRVPYRLGSVRGRLLASFCKSWQLLSGFGFLFLLKATRHVGHVEQHPGAQEAAGLPAGEAAAAPEGPSATDRGYVQIRRQRSCD